MLLRPVTRRAGRLRGGRTNGAVAPVDRRRERGGRVGNHDIEYVGLEMLVRGRGRARRRFPHPDIGLASVTIVITRSNDIRRRRTIVEHGRTAVANLLCRAFIVVVATAYPTHSVHAEQAATVKVADGVYALLGSGGEITPENRGRIANVAFVVGPRGVVVVDTGASYREGEAIIAAVQSISDQPILLAILTHPGQEAIFGAAAFQERGIPVLAHRRSAELIAIRCETCLRSLRSTLGENVMAETRVVKPDRLIEGNETLDLIGRPLRLIATEWSSAPGAVAVFDETTSTVIAGNLVSINRIPDMRDANPKAWRDALVDIESTHCRHLIPGFGPIGICADIDTFVHYFAQLEGRVAALMKEGVSLAELRNRCDLPEFASWDQYQTLHRQNANRTYLRLERLQFE